MTSQPGLEQALSYIHCQLQSPGGPGKPAVTLSRMTGSGGSVVAARLAHFLQEKTRSPCPWTVFDDNLVQKVLEEHHLPERLAEYMPENHKSMLEDTVEELLGLHPSSWTLVRQTHETIWHLASMGYVILVGRGANIITSRLPHVFHVRLVGSVEKRAKRLEGLFKLGPSAAVEFLQREDAGRRRYLKEHFDKDVDDPLLYHLVVNTDAIPYEDAAALIGQAALTHFQVAGRGR